MPRTSLGNLPPSRPSWRVIATSMGTDKGIDMDSGSRGAITAIR